MKKLSLLMALAMIITIGGVYATWTYNEGAMYVEVHEHFTISMAGVAAENAKGVVTIDTSGLSIVIDDDGGYVPRMDMSGSVKIYFAPASGAGEDAKAGKINLMYKLSASRGGTKMENVADTIEYQFGTDPAIKMFTTYDQADHEVTIPDAPRWVEEKQAFCYEIPASEFVDLIVLNTAGFTGENALDSYDKFEAFEKAINSQSYGISVWEPVSPETLGA